MAATVEAGADIDAYCSKCKLLLAHVIIAMRGSRPARVECKTCSSVHTYRDDAPKKRTTRRATSRDPAAQALAAYEGVMDGRDISRASKYGAKEVFSLEDVLDHKTFGIGLVTRVLSDKKIEVVFQTGNKILVHSR